jgi:cytochrome c2
VHAFRHACFGAGWGSLIIPKTMQNSKIIRTADTPDIYLASPLTIMGSGVDMVDHGVRDEDARADLIEFLKHSL